MEQCSEAVKGAERKGPPETNPTLGGMGKPGEAAWLCPKYEGDTGQGSNTNSQPPAGMSPSSGVTVHREDLKGLQENQFHRIYSEMMLRDILGIFM